MLTSPKMLLDPAGWGENRQAKKQNARGKTKQHQ
jgi:hypothetical protein